MTCAWLAATVIALAASHSSGSVWRSVWQPPKWLARKRSKTEQVKSKRDKIVAGVKHGMG
jgi:hypothetical protein